MRYLAVCFLLSGSTVLIAADKESPEKKALQELGELVGQWKGNGDGQIDGKKSLWRESFGWGWKFKGDDAWLVLENKDAKQLKGGTLRFDPKRKVYRFETTDPTGEQQTYEGKLNRGRLVLERTEKGTGDIYLITMYTVSEGVRLIIQSEVQTKGRGLFARQFQIAATKEGESFAGGGGRKNECVVTGGLGTMPVSFNGKTYYVCCSGCRDEFTDNPKKYVDEFEAKRKK